MSNLLDSFDINIDISDLVPSVTVEDVFYLKDLEQRKLYLYGEVTEDAASVLVRHILQYNCDDKDVSVEDRTPIRLFIFSPGGDLNAGLSIINTIEISKTPVYTYSMGEASSAGLYILLAGHKRYALKDATAVLHKGSAVLGGTASQVDNSINWYKQQLNRLKEYVLEKTTLDTRMYKKKQDEDWYLTIDEMLKYNFIDGVIDDISLIIGG